MNTERNQDARLLSAWVARAAEEQLIETAALLDEVRQELPLVWALVEPAWEARLRSIQARRGVEQAA